MVDRHSVEPLEENERNPHLPFSQATEGGRAARVWAVQAGERTVTFVGGTADPARHEEAVENVESLSRA